MAAQVGRRTSKAGFWALAVLAAASFLATACTSGDSPDYVGLPGAGGGIPSGGHGPGSGGAGEACSGDEERECHVTLGEHNGILSCYHGTQVCEGGAWSACGDGQTTQEALSAPFAGKYRALSLSSATPCVNNPCDPACKIFEEEPPNGGVRATPGGTGVTWKGGRLSDFPPGLLGNGEKEPCSLASDCQFDQFCENPSVGTCAHSQCVSGGGLTNGCNPCVSAICAVDPSCCTFPYTGLCSHDPCSTGNRLSSSCDPCVAQICAVDPYCCMFGGAWDSICLGEVASVCGKTCPGPGNWTASCADKANSVCGAQCETDAGCAHDKCEIGPKLSAGCDPCVASICAVSPACCSSTWSSDCVVDVAAICNVECPARGLCTPWAPKQTDPTCNGVDLTVGVPCTGSVPVCNHGTQTAPAGLTLLHFPPGSNQFGSCTPNQGLAGAGTCTTTQPIPAGDCINVSTCTGLVNGSEIMINPSGGGHTNECFSRCQNNWSYYNAGTCTLPNCSGSTTHSTRKKVNMIVTVDQSKSMDVPSRWDPAMTALKTFFKDTSSAGLGVALRFWPDGTPSACDGSSCSTNNCSQPAVALGTLVAATGAGDPQETALVNSINGHSPSGNTPMSAALAGATKWATTQKQAVPGEEAIVVLITDGEPTACDTSITNIASLAGDAFNTYGVRTYVIGIAGVSASTINQIATAGGGQSFFISGSADTGAELLAAMNAIKGNPISCSFPLPDTESFDVSNVSVKFTPGTGAATNLTQVSDAGLCGTGWYYDNNAAPTQLTLCPSTCTSVKGDTSAAIDITLGCPAPYKPLVYKQQYEASCPQGQVAQWGYLAYDSITPSDTSISIQVHTGTVAGTYGTLKDVVVAKASPDTQVCPMSGPSPCPRDLYAALQLPDANRAFLELVFTLNPSSDKIAAPTLSDWDLTYSCVDSE